MKTNGTGRLISSLAAATVAAATLSSLVRAQTPTLRPGQYELKTEMSIAGQPQKMPPRRDVHCYTADELQQLGNSIGHDPKQTCKVISSKATASAFTFTTDCRGPDGATSTIAGTITYTSTESFHSVVNLKDTSGRGDDVFAQGVSMDITGKRMGDCAK